MRCCYHGGSISAACQNVCFLAFRREYRFALGSHGCVLGISYVYASPAIHDVHVCYVLLPLSSSSQVLAIHRVPAEVLR